jgi:hypothetical protein
LVLRNPRNERDISPFNEVDDFAFFAPHNDTHPFPVGVKIDDFKDCVDLNMAIDFNANLIRVPSYKSAKSNIPAHFKERDLVLAGPSETYLGVVDKL